MLTSLQKDLRPSADQLRSISFFQSGMRSSAVLSLQLLGSRTNLKNRNSCRKIDECMIAGALTLHYLDTLLQRPQKEKEQFFSDLPAVLGN